MEVGSLVAPQMSALQRSWGLPGSASYMQEIPGALSWTTRELQRQISSFMFRPPILDCIEELKMKGGQRKRKWDITKA